MKERPILFSGPIVRAILEGRKTQTRRVVKLHPTEEHKDFTIVRYERGDSVVLLEEGDGLARIACPYGVVGDRLWVRETWGTYLGKTALYRASCTVDDSGERRGVWQDDEFYPLLPKWKSPLFMPRRASRITLEITGIRVERVQDISEWDAKAEGCNEAHMEHDVDCTNDNCALAGGIDDCEGVPVLSKDEYAVLWDSINAKRGFPWASNPWVWVLSFKRL